MLYKDKHFTSHKLIWTPEYSHFITVSKFYIFITISNSSMDTINHNL